MNEVQDLLADLNACACEAIEALIANDIDKVSMLLRALRDSIQENMEIEDDDEEETG